VEFRNYIESEILDLESYPKGQREERLRIVISNARVLRNDLYSEMKSFRSWRVTYGAISILALSTAFLFGDREQRDSIIGLADAVLGIAPAILSLTRPDNVLQNKPLAYAVLANEEFAP
jgi:hypothetical protein